VFRKNPLDQRLAVGRKYRITRPAVILAILTLEKSLVAQAVHEIRHPAARHQNPPVQLAEKEGALMVERFQNREFSPGELMAGDVRLGVTRNGRIRACQHYP
jgi:hypothetical protein